MLQQNYIYILKLAFLYNTVSSHVSLSFYYILDYKQDTNFYSLRFALYLVCFRFNLYSFTPYIAVHLVILFLCSRKHIPTSDIRHLIVNNMYRIHTGGTLHNNLQYQLRSSVFLFS